MPTYGGVQRSWIHLHCQHRAQCNSLSAAWLIFISGGMKIAWSIYEQPLVKSNNSVFGEIHLIVSWFIGVIIGANVAAIFVHRLSKNVAHYTSGSLVIIGGILFACIPNSFTAALVGRYLDGIAFGMTLLQAIVTGGEVPIRYLRGTVMSSERIFIWIGICTQLCYSTVFFDKTGNDSVIITDDQIHGTVAIVLGVIAILCTASFQIESPIYLHINQRESESISSIMRLQRRHHPTNEIFEIFDDNKLWIREKLTQSFKEEIQNGSTTFMKMAFLRVLVSLAISLPFHWAYVMSITTFSDSNTSMFLLAYGLAGLLGSLISVLFMDCQGRRVTSMFSLCLGGIILLALSGIFLELEIHINWTSEMRIVTILLVAYQAVNAFGFGPATTIYVSEAFAIPLKTWFITGIIAVENFVQVLTCILALTVTVNYTVFFFTIGILNCIAFLVVVFSLPETKELTLRECSRQFSGSVRI